MCTEALARLRAAGLVVDLVETDPLHIIGGTRVDDAGGFQIYQDPLVIAEQRDGSFFAGLVVDARRVRLECVDARTIAEAVDFVISGYRRP